MDEARHELTRRWLTKAAHDLQAAQMLATAPGGAIDVAIYHCQQAAEKAVKSFLIWRDEPFEKTHEIAPLIHKAAAFEPRFSELLESGHFLSPFAWEFRYPSEIGPIDPTDAQIEDALRHAQLVYDFILRILPPETHPSR